MFDTRVHVLETLNSNVITLLTFVFLHCTTLHYTTGVEGEVGTGIGTGTVLKLESESESESMPVVLISCHVMLCEEFRFRCCQFGVGVN